MCLNRARTDKVSYVALEDRDMAEEDRIKSLWVARNKAIEDSAKTVERISRGDGRPCDVTEALRVAASEIRSMLHPGYIQ